MILINLPTRTIGLSFTYNLGPWTRNKEKKVHWTVCEIFDVKDKLKIKSSILIASDRAECNPLDSFVKETGRKIALKKALENDRRKFTKWERTVIWKSYFDRGKVKVPKEFVH
jgi:hypothetical protein